MSRNDFQGSAAHVIQVGTVTGHIFAGTASTAPRVPQQLLPRGALVDRARERASVLALVAGDRGHHVPDRPPLVILTGGPGSGKTVLANDIGHDCAGHYPDGQIIAEARRRPARDILAHCLRSLGVPARDLPPDTADRAALWRSETAARRILVLFDDVTDPELVRTVLPTGPGCATLVTSIHPLGHDLTFYGGVQVELGELDSDSAMELLAGVLGTDLVRVSPEAAATILETSRRNPLTLATVAAAARHRPENDLSQIATELIQRAGSGHHPEAAALTMSFDALSPRARQLCLVLTVHPDTRFSRDAAAAGIDLAHHQAGALVDELVAARLADVDPAGQVGLHGKVRDHAIRIAGTELAAAERDAALGRFLRHYRDLAAAADEAIRPHQEHLYTATPVTIASADDAMDWYHASRGAAVALLGEAERHGGVDELACELAEDLWGPSNMDGDYEDILRTQRFGESVARRASRPVAVLALHRQSYALRHLERPEAALACSEAALRLIADHEQQWDPLVVLWLRSVALHGRSHAAEALGDLTAAWNDRMASAEIERHRLTVDPAADPHGLGLRLRRLAEMAADRDEYNLAGALIIEALIIMGRIRDATGDGTGLGRCLGSYSEILARQGRWDEAWFAGNDALRVLQSGSKRKWLLDLHQHLAHIARRLADSDLEQQHLRAALDYATPPHQAAAAGIRACLAGRTPPPAS